MPKEINLVIKRVRGQKTEYLRHEGHEHFWTQKREDAMVYSRIDVAQALAEKKIGIVQPI